MQCRTCRIESKQCHIIQQNNLNHITRTIFLKPFCTVGFLQLLNDRFFHNTLTGRNAAQLGFVRSSFNRELPVHRNPILPRQCFCPLEQFVECNCLEFAHFDQDTIGGSQPQITSANVDQVAFKVNSAILNHNFVVA
ncbi:hypothetical protein D3C78_1477180 [compost metagenome]